MFRVDRSQNRLSRLVQKRFSDLALRERDHLQEWLANRPDALGEELLIIQKEFDGFDETRERLDLLALDKDGNLVVIENKLDDSGRDVTWQALKYTAYVSGLTKTQIVDIYQQYLDRFCGGGNAVARLCEFMEVEDLGEIHLNPGNDQRMIFIAANFRREVTATVLWLLSRGIKAQCLKVTPFMLGEELILDIQQIIPTPEAADFMIGMSTKDNEEKVTQDTQKQRHKLRYAFWEAALERLRADGVEIYCNISPARNHWLSAGSGVRSCPYQMIFSKDEARVELNFGRSEASENKWLFDQLYAQKDQLEACFGAPMTWRRMDDKKQSLIVYSQPFDGYNREAWPAMIDWLSAHIQKLEATFRDPLALLNRQLRSHDEGGSLMAFTTEDDLEQWALGELRDLGFECQHGSELSPETEDPVRQSYHDTLLIPRLDAAIQRLNPALPPEAVQTVLNRVQDTEFSGDLISENRRIHALLVGGVPVTWFEGSAERNAIARLVDWENEANDWLVVNQFEVVGQTARRPDIVIFLNGMPLIVIELKGTETGTLKGAYNQIETYKAQVPALFRTNAFLVISEGVTARYGSLSANLDRFMRWRTVDGDTLVEDGTDLALQTLIHGLLAPSTILELMRYCMVFEDEGKGPIKKIAAYHQFHAVRKAVGAVLRAQDFDSRGGVMWHTQGSGKSLLMAFLAGRLMLHPELENPTVVVITDRNDLDNQLYATFSRCEALFGEVPEQAEDVPDLRRKLDRRKVGGVIFATMQKFRPQKGETSFGQLTDRSNVIVFADEAHRSQYGFEAKLNAETGETRYGFAHHLREALPNAVHVGFTGTPISLVGADTQAVFGEYIDVYDIAQAVEDGATVPIYYEGRVAKIALGEDVGDLLDAEYEEILEDAEDGGAELDDETRKAMTRKWARVEALVGAGPRLDRVVEDILQHFDARLEAMDGGKAMIVCMSRRICVEVYNRIVAARPDWHADDDATGEVKVVMTGAAQDPAEFQPHIRSKARLETLRTRYRDPSDPFKLVIVRDMWLTGFDAPCMHTLYTDKPMKGHGLMQAITRINRVFGAKPSGLVVDYIGLAADLKAALNHYSNADRKQTGIDQREAVHALLTQLDIMRSMFHGVDYMSAVQGTPRDRIKMLPVAIEHALNLKVDGETPKDRTESKKRFMKGVAGLVKAFRIASGTAEAEEVKDEVGFFTAVQAAIRKMDAGSMSGRSVDEADLAISQLLNRSVTSTEVIDILEAAGINRPDIGVLSEEFLLGLKNNPHQSLAVEALKKLLNGEIRTRTRTNNTKKEMFSKRLEEALARYHNRSVDALQVIQEMIAIAKALQEEPEDGLSPEEAAFYDALAMNQSAVELMGNEELRIIATELVMTVRQNARVDWWRRDDIRKKMRVSIRRILRKHGFPPDLQSDAIKKVVQQAEVLAREFA